MTLYLGLAELLLAGLLCHRALPMQRAINAGSAVRLWSFAFAIADLGAAQIIASLGERPPAYLSSLGHGALLLSGLLWLGAARRAPVQGWADVAAALEGDDPCN